MEEAKLYGNFRHYLILILEKYRAGEGGWGARGVWNSRMPQAEEVGRPLGVFPPVERSLQGAKVAAVTCI